MTDFQKLCKNLEAKIQSIHTEGITMQEAEKLAAEFLGAQIAVSEELKVADLDARMRKTGAKAVKAAIYLDIVQKSEKKPTEAQITAMIDSDAIVQGEQNEYDKAEVEKEDLERYYNIFREGHIYCRGIAKGNFGG